MSRPRDRSTRGNASVHASDAYRAERHALVSAVTEGEGWLPAGVRRAIVDRARGKTDHSDVSPMLAGFADQVARDAARIGDGDVDALLAEGLHEEAVFETIAAAALGASLVRLERVDELLAEES